MDVWLSISYLALFDRVLDPSRGDEEGIMNTVRAVLSGLCVIDAVNSERSVRVEEERGLKGTYGPVRRLGMSINVAPQGF